MYYDSLLLKHLPLYLLFKTAYFRLPQENVKINFFEKKICKDLKIIFVFLITQLQ